MEVEVEQWRRRRRYRNWMMRDDEREAVTVGSRFVTILYSGGALHSPIPSHDSFKGDVERWLMHCTGK